MTAPLPESAAVKCCGTPASLRQPMCSATLIVLMKVVLFY
jgi:hypothetical protein